MQMAVVSSKGQVVIPAQLRKKYRLERGATILFQEERGRLILEPSNFAALYALRGSLKNYPLQEMLNAEREDERRREDEK